MKPFEKQKHMLATYLSLRYGVAIIGALLPLTLWFWGAAKGIELQNSMSAYYHAISLTLGYSMRDWFVGILFAIGISLILYKGFSRRENVALNIAGILAVCVALFPMNWNNGDETASISIHGTCAVLFFVCISYVCIKCAKETLFLLNNEVLERKYGNIYKILGIGMLLSPLIALIITFLFQQLSSYTFFVEAVGVWIFATYWIIKSRELSITQADKKYIIEQNETDYKN